VTTDQVTRQSVSLWPDRPPVRRIRPFRWSWRVLDQATGVVMDQGYSARERWAEHRRDVVANRIWASRWEKRVKAADDGA
jgi:hypothetical protein